MVMYLYTAHIPLQFIAVNNNSFFGGGEIGRQLVKEPLAAFINP